LSWDFRVHDWRVHAIHMIFVAQQAVLTRCAAVVTGLAETLFHLTEIGHEILRIALLVALEVAVAFFKDMAGQTAAILDNPYTLTDPNGLEMRLMDKIREASMFALDGKRGEIDHPPLSLDIVDAVAFRA
jgi:hypothetical protein